MMSKMTFCKFTWMTTFRIPWRLTLILLDLDRLSDLIDSDHLESELSRNLRDLMREILMSLSLLSQVRKQILLDLSQVIRTIREIIHHPIYLIEEWKVNLFPFSPSHVVEVPILFLYRWKTKDTLIARTRRSAIIRARCIGPQITFQVMSNFVPSRRYTGYCQVCTKSRSIRALDSWDNPRTPHIIVPN